MATPQIPVSVCERLVEAGSKPCPAPVAAPSAPQPEWDALANSFASLGVALTWGGLLLGAIALVAGFAWAKLIRRDAEREAREEARLIVGKMIEEWKANEAPQIVRRHVEFLRDASIGDTDDDEAADEIGEGAG